MSTPTTAKPPVKARTSRATRAANATQKPAPAADPKPELTVVPPAGSNTGDNGHGHKRVAARAAAKADPKPAPAADKAAKPVKLTASKAKADAGPTKTSMNRAVAKAMVKAVADMIAGWKPEDHEGITAEFAAAGVASWLNYSPVPADGWDDRLPPRSGAGGRGAARRANA